MNHRTRRNVARTAGLALVVLSLLLIGQPGSAGADGPAATLKARGWWWEAQQLPAPLPPPPNVKPGQLYVQGSPNGKSAFSAVRYELSAGQNVGSLSLKIGENGDQGGSSAVLLACRTGSAWSPADAGQWSAAPQVTTSCVNGLKSTDGASWTFAVAPLQTGTVLDIAVIPGVDPATKQPATFALTFDAPSDGSLTTVAGSTPSAGSTSNNFSPTGSPSGVGSTSGVGSSSGVTPRPPAVSPVASGLPADKVGETATSPAKQAATQPPSTTLNTANASSSKPNKTAGIIVLIFAALVGLYAYRQDNLMARNGGVLPGSDGEVGGLGRFTKPRTGQPPALT